MVNVLPVSIIDGADGVAGAVELLLQLIMKQLPARRVKNKKGAIREFFINYLKIKLLTRREINSPKT
jgi:hypothetical protein